MKPRIFKSLKKNKTKKSKRSKGTKKQFGGMFKFDTKGAAGRVSSHHIGSKHVQSKERQQQQQQQRPGGIGHEKWFADITRLWGSGHRTKFIEIYLQFPINVRKAFANLYKNMRPGDREFIEQTQVLQTLLLLNQQMGVPNGDYAQALDSFIKEYRDAPHAEPELSGHLHTPPPMHARAGAAENFDAEHFDDEDAEVFHAEGFHAVPADAEAAEEKIRSLNINGQEIEVGTSIPKDVLHAAKVLVYLHNRRYHNINHVRLIEALQILNAAGILLQLRRGP